MKGILYALMIVFYLIVPSCKAMSLEDNRVEIDVKHSIKVLLLGSSFGVNTIIQFPFICNTAGIDIVCGNLCLASASLSDIVGIINGEKKWSSGHIYTVERGKWAEATTDFKEMLRYCQWDYIIVQRASYERLSWTPLMADNLRTIMDYINNNVKKPACILFNPTFAYPLFDRDKEKQIAETSAINSSALAASKDLNLEVIPVATAVQNARLTSLMGIGSVSQVIPDMAEDEMHLDTGIGSFVAGALLYEWICGRYFLSIMNVEYIPNLAEVSSITVFPARAFTPINLAEINVAKECVKAACQDPFVITKSLGQRFPYRAYVQ